MKQKRYWFTELQNILATLVLNALITMESTIEMCSYQNLNM